MLARVPLAAGQVEIRVELTVLAQDFRPVQVQPIRSEQPAEIGVRQRARVRGIASPFEAVELPGALRVGRRDLVDHEHPASPPRHPRQLRNDQLGSVHVMQGARAGDQVE